MQKSLCAELLFLKILCCLGMVYGGVGPGREELREPESSSVRQLREQQLKVLV